MSMNPAGVRARVPLPKNHSRVLAWVVFLVGSVMLYDVYSGDRGTWPISSIFPW